MELIQSTDHIACQLEADEQVSPLAYKALRHYAPPFGLMPSMVMFNDRERFLYGMPARGAVSMADIRQDTEQQQAVLAALGSLLRFCGEKSFLQMQYIYLDPERVYYTEDALPCFILVPYRSDGTDTTEQWETECRAFLEAVSPGMFTDKDMPDVLRYLTELQEPEATVTKQGLPDGKRPELSLRYQGTFGMFAFYVISESFVIGSGPDVSGSIAMNPAISRRHCEIGYADGVYFVRDLGSRNHTFVNGRQLAPEQRCPLHDGDSIRLADMEFMTTIR